MISIILPTKDRPQLLSRSISNLARVNLGESEVLIIDDSRNSESKLANRELTAKNSRLRYFDCEEYFKERKKGIGEILNFGVTNCLGEFVARMDDDDLSFPRRFRYQQSFMRKHSLDLLGSQAINVNQFGRYRSTSYLPTKAYDVAEFLQFENPFIHSSVMFKRQSFLRIGGYDVDLTTSQDYDLWVRMINSGFKCCISKKRLVIVMRWDQSITSRTSIEERKLNISHAKRNTSSQTTKYEKIYEVRRNISEGNFQLLKSVLKELKIKNAACLMSHMFYNECIGYFKYSFFRLLRWFR